MGNQLTRANGANAITLGEEYGFEPSKVQLIKELIAKDATNNELALFLYTAQRTGLDPLAKQIYCIKRKGKMTIQTGIDGYRLIADRTGNYAPGRANTFEYDEQGGVYSATAYVMKYVRSTWHEVSATAYWDEYVVMYDGKPSDMWASKPRVMLGKCAESLALRKAFPAELSGLYTAEEMGDSAIIDAEVVPQPQAPPTASAEITPDEAAEKFWATFGPPLGGDEWARVVDLLGEPVEVPRTVDDWRHAYKRVDRALRARIEQEQAE